MKIKVREKILLITITTFLSATIVNTSVISRMLRRGYSTALKSEANAIANPLKMYIEKTRDFGISPENIRGFETQCQEVLHKHNEVSYVMVTNMNGTFYGTTGADPDVSSWDTSKVTSTRDMFRGATSANPDVSNWDTSSVTDMRSMFHDATSADPDVSGWNTSSVALMSDMFRNATSADPDVSGWDVSNVTSMSNMFLGVTL